MRRVVALAALTFALAAGSASADTFQVLPTGAAQLSSAEVPNAPGAILLPTNAFAAPIGLPQQRSYEELRTLWLEAGAAYGIPWQVLAAINKIESNFGRNMGPSSAGAVGWMQFMPDTWLRWGTDGNGDGIADPWNPDDAVHAAARYLAAAGGRTDISRAIFAYNHAQWYVDDVLELATLFGGGSIDTDAVFALDRLGVALERAQQSVAAAGDALQRADERQLEFAERAEALTAHAEDPTLLLSDRLPAQSAAYEAEAASADAAAVVASLQAELSAAETELEAVRTGAHASSFNPAAAGLLGGPTRADGYVFPVGGGPSVVSVGHDHHDYPAADIAAPEGSPVYALADAVVLEAVDDDRCGIGILLQTSDGIRWVYCHLSFREPAVQPDAFLPAGQLVGLVGSTGHSSGPHLHLALKPETGFPQEQTWFREFAGTAFSWQDVPTALPVRSAPIFAAVPAAEDLKADDVVEFTTTPSGG